ncbi:transposase [Deferribacter abyssi]|uniref:transposase n=1 Tax=Deferribacter abyssi TaxID=213806 RepID=UPI003C1ABC65
MSTIVATGCKRTIIDSQQEYVNRYLYSAIDPINGGNYHMYKMPDVNTLTTKTFLDELKEYFKDYHLIIVWDNASFHKSKKLEDEDLTIIFLPSYSPELNPVERFYGEIRKVTANQIFESIENQEKLIDKALTNYMLDKESVKKLCGYDWIIQSWNSM